MCFATSFSRSCRTSSVKDNRVVIGSSCLASGVLAGDAGGEVALGLQCPKSVEEGKDLFDMKKSAAPPLDAAMIAAQRVEHYEDKTFAE